MTFSEISIHKVHILPSLLLQRLMQHHPIISTETGKIRRTRTPEKKKAKNIQHV
jgi:hypothetical protein